MGDRTQHSRLSASGAERWMECPGSVPLHELAVPDEADNDSEYAAEGVAAHEVGDKCLTDGLEAYELIGQSFNGFECTADMSDAVQMYVDFCRSIWASADQDHEQSFMEIETSLSETGQIVVHPDFGGTADFCARSGNDWLHIADYKHGQGIAVSIKNNTQLKYYGLGKLLDNQQVKKVRLTIVQPRIPWFEEGVIRTVEMYADDLRRWAGELTATMNAIDKDLGLKPGEHCRFCPAKIVCPVMQGMFRAAANANIKKVDVMSNSALAAEKSRISMVKMYINAVEKETYSRLDQGQENPLYKMVTKFGNRVFKKGADMLLSKKYGDNAFAPPKVKTPAQIEKLVGGKKFCAQYAHKPKIGLTVVERDDPRAGVKMETAAETYVGLTVPPANE